MDNYPQEVASNAVAGNGVAPSVKDAVEEQLTAAPMTEGYKPTLPLWALSTDASYLPNIYIIRDIELMLTHPMVLAPLDYFKGGLAGVEPASEANSPEVKQFVDDHIQRYWQDGMPAIQNGYEYGWEGLEATYTQKNNYLAWDNLIPFSPHDTFLLTQDHKPIGVRVKNVPDKGSVDLWLGTEDVPAKALWYAHRPRFNQYYGRSQILGAWRPWRRLAWKDAAETVTDSGIYRYGVTGPVVYFPDEDMQISTMGGLIPASTTADSQGRPRRFARDIARFIAEQYKAGAGVGMPSTKYPPEMGGGDKWKLDLPKNTLNVSGLIEYVKYLQDQICYGCGVAPELLEASETGSGYSGRKLPMEAFLMAQQKIANAILKIFVDNILTPLVRWNFGTSAIFKATIPNILKMSRQAASGATTSADGSGGANNNPDRPDQTPGPVSPEGAPTPVQTTAGAAMSLAGVSPRVRAIAERIRGAAA